MQKQSCTGLFHQNAFLQASDQQANQQGRSKTGSLNKPDEVQGEGVDEIVAEGSDNLINIQA